MKKNPKIKVLTSRIMGCARCGLNHDVEVKPFTKVPRNTSEGQIICTHFATCPTTNEPILITQYSLPVYHATQK